VIRSFRGQRKEIMKEKKELDYVTYKPENMVCYFYSQMTQIGFSKSSCTGRELSYNDCKKEEGEGGCISKQYASVVCSREPPADSKLL